MVCHDCEVKAKKHGRNRNGSQRWRCKLCKKTYTEGCTDSRGELGPMRVPFDKAVLALNLLVEGSSIRSIERVTGVHRDTVMRLLVYVGERCERFLEQTVRDVPVNDVQADEIWGFVGIKEKTKAKKGVEDARLGDAYCFTALERDSKLLLAWHLGRRTTPHTDAFVEKLERATAGRFQITTDGFAAYPESMHYHLGTRTDYATLVKKYGYEDKDERRYSPPSIIGIEKTHVYGDPDWENVCTSHVERHNLTIRMQLRRLTRLTNAFSKKWKNLRAALALFFAWYNFCRSHKTLSNATPAMAAGLVSTPWSIAQLVNAALSS